MNDDLELIARLAQRIESKHQAALQALNTLRAFFDDECHNNGTQFNSFAELAASQLGANTAKSGLRSFRETVLNALSDVKWQTVDEIVDESRLDAKSVRGVLYAPTRDDLGIEARKTDRGAEFRKRS